MAAHTGFYACAHYPPATQNPEVENALRSAYGMVDQDFDAARRRRRS